MHSCLFWNKHVHFVFWNYFHLKEQILLLFPEKKVYICFYFCAQHREGLTGSLCYQGLLVVHRQMYSGTKKKEIKKSQAHILLLV